MKKKNQELSFDFDNENVEEIMLDQEDDSSVMDKKAAKAAAKAERKAAKAAAKAEKKAAKRASKDDFFDDDDEFYDNKVFFDIPKDSQNSSVNSAAPEHEPRSLLTPDEVMGIGTDSDASENGGYAPLTPGDIGGNESHLGNDLASHTKPTVTVIRDEISEMYDDKSAVSAKVKVEAETNSVSEPDSKANQPEKAEESVSADHEKDAVRSESADENSAKNAVETKDESAEKSDRSDSLLSDKTGEFSVAAIEIMRKMQQSEKARSEHNSDEPVRRASHTYDRSAEDAQANDKIEMAPMHRDAAENVEKADRADKKPDAEPAENTETYSADAKKDVESLSYAPGLTSSTSDFINRQMHRKSPDSEPVKAESEDDKAITSAKPVQQSTDVEKSHAEKAAENIGTDKPRFAKNFVMDTDANSDAVDESETPLKPRPETDDPFAWKKNALFSRNPSTIDRTNNQSVEKAEQMRREAIDSVNRQRARNEVSDFDEFSIDTILTETRTGKTADQLRAEHDRNKTSKDGLRFPDDSANETPPYAHRRGSTYFAGGANGANRNDSATRSVRNVARFAEKAASAIDDNTMSIPIITPQMKQAAAEKAAAESAASKIVGSAVETAEGAIRMGENRRRSTGKHFETPKDAAGPIEKKLDVFAFDNSVIGDKVHVLDETVKNFDVSPNVVDAPVDRTTHVTINPQESAPIAEKAANDINDVPTATAYPTGRMPIGATREATKDVVSGLFDFAGKTARAEGIDDDIRTYVPGDSQDTIRGESADIADDATRIMDIHDVFSGDGYSYPDEATHTDHKGVEIIDEYNSVEDAQSITSDLIKRKRKLGRRAAITVIDAAILIAIALIPTLFPFGTSVYFIAIAALLVIAMLTNISTFQSLASVFSAKPDIDFAPSLAVVAALIQDVVAGLSELGTLKPSGIFAAAAVVTLAANTIGKRLIVSRMLANLELIANEEEKQAGVFIGPPVSASIADPKKIGDSLIFGRRHTVDLKGFLAYSQSPDLYEKQSGRIGLISMILAFVSAGAVAITTSSLVQACGAFAAVCCAAAPICAMYPSGVMLSGVCRKLRGEKVVLSGFKAAEEISDANVVVLDSDELFHDDGVKLYKFRTFGDYAPDEAFLVSAALTREGRSPLAGMFMQIAMSNDSRMPAADSVIYEENMGITGWVDERKTLIGNRMLMESHNISVPSIEVDRRILQSGKFPVYLAVEEKIVALFIVGYDADKNMLHRVRRLVNTGITVLVRTMDPNVDIDLISSRYGLPLEAVCVMPAAAACVYNENMHPTASERAVISAPTPEGFVDGYVSACGIRRAEIASSVCTIVLTLVAIALCIVFPMVGLVKFVNMFTMLATYVGIALFTAITGKLCS